MDCPIISTLRSDSFERVECPQTPRLGYLVFSKVAAPMRLAEGVPTFSARKLEEAFAFASDERSTKIKE